MTLNSYKLPVPAASSLALKHRSTEGNTLTGLTNLLRWAIQQKRTVHRFFCIVTLVLVGVTVVSAQGSAELRRRVVQGDAGVPAQGDAVVPAQGDAVASADGDSQRPKLPAVKGVSPPTQEEAPTAPPNAPGASPADPAPARAGGGG